MFTGFASDNTAGVHPRIMKAVLEANTGYCRPYGFDEWSEAAISEFRKLFGEDAQVFFALSGTGGNVMSLRTMLRPWQGVICSDVAHINTDESGAPEWVGGVKLLPLPADEEGKIHPGQLARWAGDIKDCHHATPHALSITQTTEFGGVYSLEEVRALTAEAHAMGLVTHMDGTRIANAVASLGVDVCELTRNSGIDILSFGGTKNGLMLAEAVVVFRPELAEDFLTMRKQSLQLVSKMRFVAAQFTEALRDGLWLENARHANEMARYFASELNRLPHMEARTPAANALFVRMKPEHMSKLMEKYYFYEVDHELHIARLMCSFATTREEIVAFVQDAAALV